MKKHVFLVLLITTFSYPSVTVHGLSLNTDNEKKLIISHILIQDHQDSILKKEFFEIHSTFNLTPLNPI